MILRQPIATCVRLNAPQPIADSESEIGRSRSEALFIAKVLGNCGLLAKSIRLGRSAFGLLLSSVQSAQLDVGRRRRCEYHNDVAGTILVSEPTGRPWYLPLVVLASAYLLFSIVDRALPLEGSSEVLKPFGEMRGAILVGFRADLKEGGDQMRAYVVPGRLFSGRGIVVNRQSGSFTARETARPLIVTGLVLLAAVFAALRRRMRATTLPA
jgi:hypothetical protein